MHIFPALIGKLRRDVTNDKEVLLDRDFPFIHRTVDNDTGCLEASIRMVYCAAFDCKANRSKNKITCTRCGWFKFPGEPGAKISLKEDDVHTLFPVVEAVLIPPMRRTQAATRASTTTVHLGSKRAVSADTGDVSSR